MMFLDSQFSLWGDMNFLLFFLVIFRVGAAISLMPAFGEKVVSARVKLGVTLAFSALIAPLVLERGEDFSTQTVIFLIVLPELIAGFVVGFLFRIFVFALQIGGSIAAQATSLSQFFGGGIGADPQPAFSTLLVVAGLCVAIMLGLHIRIIEIFLISYDIFPIAGWPSGNSLADWGVKKCAYAFSLGFTLASPFIIVSLIYNLGLGIINRAMPQLMVALVGAPAISFGGLIILLITSPILLSVWGDAFRKISTPSGAGF